MFRNLQLKSTPDRIEPVTDQLTSSWLEQYSEAPILLSQINLLPENIKKRVYRILIPPELLARFQIDPVSWKGAGGGLHVRLDARAGSNSVRLMAFSDDDRMDEFFHLEISDNAEGSLEIKMLQLNDPQSPRFGTVINREVDQDVTGKAGRNLEEEQRAMEAGLAPGQIRDGLGALKITLNQFETFLAATGHRAYFLEPQFYSAAWLFEKRGFAYVRGHKLMDNIHAEFQHGGRLHQALDSSTSFRKPDAWRFVRGRAWAIHDGILEAISEKWEDLRMVKQVGRKAGVETFPGAEY
ncbi:MAG: hypothetical protein ACK2U3_17600 [Anaerolineales bacterium]|jgi:hypothetical protein